VTSYLRTRTGHPHFETSTSHAREHGQSLVPYTWQEVCQTSSASIISADSHHFPSCIVPLVGSTFLLAQEAYNHESGSSALGSWWPARHVLGQIGGQSAQGRPSFVASTIRSQRVVQQTSTRTSDSRKCMKSLDEIFWGKASRIGISVAMPSFPGQWKEEEPRACFTFLVSTCSVAYTQHP
jgi:hypothetical protein